MEWGCLIILWVIWPVICYNLAKGKGRDTGMAILSGLVFGVFAVLYYAIIQEK